MSSYKRIVVFGATSAIAHEAARLWAARGASLFLVGRNPGKLERVAQDVRARLGPDAKVGSLAADLDIVAAHAGILDQAAAALGGIDLVLVAQGTLPDQAKCQADVAETLAQVHTNGTAVVSLCALAGNRLEAQGSGCLAVITSVAGDRGRQSNYTYGAAKGLVTRFLQGLRNRLAKRGVAVVDIRPGFVDTPMTAGIEKGGPLWATPQRVAAIIVAATDARRDVVYAPWFWRPIMAIIRSIPEKMFKKMSL